MAYSLFWSTGNSKLRKTKTASFNLPAFKSADGFRVCPGSGICSAACYARQSRYILPDAIRTREHNLAIVRGSLPLFEQLAAADLERLPHRTIRIHDSGDFFSQDYLNAWFRLARRFHARRFYCYTKSLHLDWSDCPPNLRYVQSAGGRFDRLINYAKSHARIFPSHAERKAAGYIDGNRTDYAAQTGVTRIGLVYHGSRKLTDKIANALRRGA